MKKSELLKLIEELHDRVIKLEEENESIRTQLQAVEILMKAAKLPYKVPGLPYRPPYYTPAITIFRGKL